MFVFAELWDPLAGRVRAEERAGRGERELFGFLTELAGQFAKQLLGLAVV